MLRAVRHLVDAEGVAYLHERHLGGVSDGRARVLVGDRVAGQKANANELVLRAVAVIDIRCIHQPASRIELLHGHAVLREGTGLVRADHRHAAERFDGFEVLDDGMLACHFLRADGQHDGHDGAERLRDGRHRQRHGEHERIEHARAAANHRQHEHEHANGHDAHREFFREFVKAYLERGLTLLGLVHERRNAADLSSHARGRNHRLGAPVRDERPRKHHVRLIADAHLALLDGVGGLLHRLALPRQRALVHFERKALQHASIGRHEVARLQHKDVTRHHIARGHLDQLAIAAHLGYGCAHGLEAGQRLLRLHRLHRAQHGVQHEDDQDDDRALNVARDGRDQRGNGKNSHKQVLELAEKNSGDALATGVLQLVRAVAFEPRSRLRGRKTLPIRMQLGQRLLSRQAVRLSFHRPPLPESPRSHPHLITRRSRAWNTVTLPSRGTAPDSPTFAEQFIPSRPVSAIISGSTRRPMQGRHHGGRVVF